MACPWTDSLIFHIFVRAKTTVILEAAFQIDNKERHFQKKMWSPHNQIQTLFNHLSETEKVFERSLRQGNLLNIASRGNRGVKDEKTIEQAWTAKTGYWTLYVLKRYHLFPRLHLSSLENRFPGTICGRSTTRCLYLMLSGSQLPFMQVLLVIPVSFFQAKSFGRNYKRLLSIQQAYLLQHWSIYWNIYLLWDSLWGEMHPTCIFYCWSSIMIRDLHTRGSGKLCKILEVHCLVPWSNLRIFFTLFHLLRSWPTVCWVLTGMALSFCNKASLNLFFSCNCFPNVALNYIA